MAGNRKTDNTVAKRKRAKVQITIYKTISSIVAVHFLNYIPVFGTHPAGNAMVLFRHFGLLLPKDFNIIWLSNILALDVPDKMLFLKPAMFTKFDIYIFICPVCINGCPVSWIIVMSCYYK